MDRDEHRPANLADAARGSAIWVTGAYAVEFIVQFVALILLARLLSPLDFGLFAIALVLTSAGEAVFRIGLGPAIVQMRGAVESHLDVAWTINVCLGFIAAGILALAAPWVLSGVFNAPAALPIAWLLCFGVAISGLISPRVLLMRRAMEYRRLAVLDLQRPIWRYGGAVGFALLLQNVWALAIGYVLGVLMEVSLSYVLAPRRPRLSWDRSKFDDLFKFSRWLQINNWVRWGERQLDVTLVGGLLGAQPAGLYSRALALSRMPFTLVEQISNKVLYPVYSAGQAHAGSAGRQFLLSVDFVLIVYSPIILVLGLHADEAVRLILGAQWLSMAPALLILVLAGAVQALNGVAIAMLRSRAVVQVEFVGRMLSLIVMVISMLWLIPTQGIVGAALGVLAGQFAMMPVLGTQLHRRIAIRLARPTSSVLTVAVCSLLIAASVSLWPESHWVMESVAACAGLLLLLVAVGGVLKVGPGKTLMQLIELVLARRRPGDALI